MKNNIGSLRKAKGLSMQELADIAGTSQQQIDRLEKGQRKLTAEWMQKLSEALGCKPGELIDFTPSTKITAKVETTVAKVLGAIETKFSNKIREFQADEQYDISFKPNKKDFGKKFFALVVEGGHYKNYPENSELIFTLEKSTIITKSLAENSGDFLNGNNKMAKSNGYKFEIGKNLVEGQLVKSIRSE